MSGFAFVVEYDGTLTPAQNAARRGPDYLVRVPNDHLLLGIGSTYFRQDGAAAPPAGAAAVVAVVPDCMTLGLLEGLVCDAVIGPSGNAALYGTHCFQPDFLGRVIDMALAGLGEEVLDIGVLTGLIRALKAQRKWRLGGTAGRSRGTRASPGGGPLACCGVRRNGEP